MSGITLNAILKVLTLTVFHKTSPSHVGSDLTRKYYMRMKVRDKVNQSKFGLIFCCFLATTFLRFKNITDITFINYLYDNKYTLIIDIYIYEYFH